MSSERTSIEEFPILYSVIQGSIQSYKISLERNLESDEYVVSEKRQRIDSSTLSPVGDCEQIMIHSPLFASPDKAADCYVSNSYSRFREKITSDCEKIYEESRRKILALPLAIRANLMPDVPEIISQFSENERMLNVCHTQAVDSLSSAARFNEIFRFTIHEKKNHRNVVSIFSTGDVQCNCSHQYTCIHEIYVLKIVNEKLIVDGLIDILFCNSSCYQIDFEEFSFDTHRIAEFLQKQLHQYQNGYTSRLFAPFPFRESTCPICLISIDMKNIQNVLACPNCKNNIHRDCLKSYENAVHSSGFKCVFCRACLNFTC